MIQNGEVPKLLLQRLAKEIKKLPLPKDKNDFFFVFERNLDKDIFKRNRLARFVQNSKTEIVTSIYMS